MGKWQRVLYQPNTPLGENGQRVTASKEHIVLSKEAAKEGMVLLKNENDMLPFAKGTKIALFGKGTFDYVKGGGGSGDVTVEYVKNLYEGFMALKNHVSVYEKTADYYREYVNGQYAQGCVPGMLAEPELSDELCVGARAFADTAVISISRFSGEGWDHNSVYDKEWPWNDQMYLKSKEIFRGGDFYLTDAEQSMVEKVKKYFSNIVVVLNIGGVIDTSWFVNDEKISSALLGWNGGMEGGTAMAELLCGISNPSGKLADTFAKKLEDYPSTLNFHDSWDYVEYTDDIYVGYRYFETIPNAVEKVNYPFGYGLSYTKFDWSVLSVEEQNNKVQVRVSIVNVGKVSGKEVLQVYGSAPQGKLGKANKSLVAFQKTRLLQPGESQIVIMEFDIRDMASYDDLGKIAKSAYILEQGEYRFYVGTSVRDVVLADFVYRLDEDVIVRQLSAKLVPTSLPSRMLADGSFEELPMSQPHKLDDYELEFLDKIAIDGNTPDARKPASYNLWRDGHKAGIRLFGEVFEGKMSLDEFIGQLTDEELAYMLGGQPNTACANTCGMGNLPEYGVPNIMTADGPAGLRIAPECGVNTTAWPCATLLACTWNPEMICAVGEAGAKEVKENNIAMWLTPAINIHRNPLCGRNFEYYSEDPYLTGVLAGAMVKGIQSQNISVAVKHFALNNKETNRKNSDSRVSERAAREIYLKAFEMIVRDAKPWCIMSSYNIINGKRASECRELLHDILREEWGYEGLVTSDWWTFGEHYLEVKAGNDIKMAYGLPMRLLEAKEKGLLSREEMEICGKRILELILKID